MTNPLKIYKDERKQWRWRITAPNGKIIGASTEAYKRRKDCEQNVRDIASALLREMIEAVTYYTGEGLV